MKRLFKMENVEVNSMVIGVAVEINEEEKTLIAMYGGARVTWRYSSSKLPKVQNVMNKDRATRLIAKRAIFQRLASEGFDTYAITSAYYSERDNGVFLPLVDGVWLICYDNAYVKGQIDGRYFVWNPNCFKSHGVYVDSLDLDDGTGDRFKVNKVINRITKDYSSLASIINAAKNKIIEACIDDKFFEGFEPNTNTITNTNTISQVAATIKNVFSLDEYTSVPESITTAACAGFDVEDSIINTISNNSKPVTKNTANTFGGFKLL